MSPLLRGDSVHIKSAGCDISSEDFRAGKHGLCGETVVGNDIMAAPAVDQIDPVAENAVRIELQVVLAAAEQGLKDLVQPRGLNKNQALAIVNGNGIAGTKDVSNDPLTYSLFHNTAFFRVYGPFIPWRYGNTILSIR
ncbi:hypothetical protein LMIY3S_00427 [Labrys miyagiensis]